MSSCAREELHLDSCRADGVRVLRRTSGGAAVYLTPGVVCFSVLLPYESCPDARTIRGAYRCVARAVESSLSPFVRLVFEPPGDLAVGGRKLVGFAQARRRRGALVHGVVAASLDAAEVARYVSHPPAEPAYRAGRTHEEFMTSLEREAGPSAPEFVARELRNALAREFGAAGPWPGLEPLAQARRLVAEKYVSDEWTFRR